MFNIVLIYLAILFTPSAAIFWAVIGLLICGAIGSHFRKRNYKLLSIIVPIVYIIIITYFII